MTGELATRLDARDRALFVRCVLAPSAPDASRRFWTALTHLGGAWASVALAGVPLTFADGRLRIAAVQASWTLAISHLVVQVIKRTVVRTRPCLTARAVAHVSVPDRFSFPSGHSAAVMSVAFTCATAFPTVALPTLALAMLVGFSRVRLGVHYPGDVLVGQAIAIVAAVAVRAGL